VEFYEELNLLFIINVTFSDRSGSSNAIFKNVSYFDYEENICD
jgi:hypothetical protein